MILLYVLLAILLYASNYVTIRVYRGLLTPAYGDMAVRVCNDVQYAYTDLDISIYACSKVAPRVCIKVAIRV